MPQYFGDAIAFGFTWAIAFMEYQCKIGEFNVVAHCSTHLKEQTEALLDKLAHLDLFN